MKQILLLALAAVSFARLGVAASCTGGSLASYAALGATGCTIGGDTLYDFKILPGSGVTELGGGSVTITPMGGVYTPGLTISINQSASGGNAIETMFTYDISGSPFTSISTVLSGSSVTTLNDGVTNIVNYCEGGSFGADGVDGCTGPNNGSLLTLKDFDPTLDQLTDMGAFSKVPFLAVTDDFMLDSGGGTAKGGTITNSFTAVPEPVSTALAGLGLALVGAVKVRTMRRKQESK